MTHSVTSVLKQHRSFIMGAAMLSIMLFHQPWYKVGFFRFFELTGDLGVELFLFVSGWGIFNSLSKNNLQTYFKNRFLRLMPSCVLIGMVQVLIEKTGFIGGSSNPIALVMMCIGLFKWYIFAIICYYILAPLLYRFVTDWKRMLLLTIVVLLIIFYSKTIRFLDDSSSVFLTTLPIIIYRFPAFLFGFWFARRPMEMNIRTMGLGIIAYALVLLGAYRVIDSHYNAVLCYLLFSFSIPTLIYLSKGYIQCLSQTIVYKAVKWIGVCSLEMYLWHDFWFRGFSAGSITENTMIQVILSLTLTFALVWGTKRIVLTINNK